LFVLRAVALFAAFFLLALVAAWLVTRERRYLRIAAKGLQLILLLLIAFALVYVFERVLLL
jgi:hypothetical protein